MIRRIFLAIAAAIAVASPLVIAGAVPASAGFSNTYTDCSQSSSLGTRVCIDKTTGYGPVAVIYTSGSTIYAQFGVSGSGGLVSSGTFTAIEWVGSSGTSTYACGLPSPPSASSCVYTVEGSGDAYNLFGMNAGQHDLFEFFAASAGYELVIAN